MSLAVAWGEGAVPKRIVWEADDVTVGAAIFREGTRGKQAMETSRFLLYSSAHPGISLVFGYMVGKNSVVYI